MRNTRLSYIDFSSYYSANANRTICIKTNSEIYPSPYSNPVFINKVKTTVEDLNTQYKF